METVSEPIADRVLLEDLEKVTTSDITEVEIIKKILDKAKEIKERTEKKIEAQKQTFVKLEPRKESFFQRFLLARILRKNIFY